MMKCRFATKLNMSIKGKKTSNLHMLIVILKRRYLGSDMEMDFEMLENIIKDKSALDESVKENTISEWPKDAANDLSYSKMKYVTSLRHPKKLLNG